MCVYVEWRVCPCRRQCIPVVSVIAAAATDDVVVAAVDVVAVVVVAMHSHAFARNKWDITNDPPHSRTHTIVKACQRVRAFSESECERESERVTEKP